MVIFYKVPGYPAIYPGMNASMLHSNLWEHGKEIAKALKAVQIQGLTGAIR